MKSDFLYCNKPTKDKNKTCFGLCDLNYTLYLSPPVARFLSLSRSCAPALENHREREKKNRLQSVVDSIYTNGEKNGARKSKTNKKKKTLAQFLCNITRYMLLMFDLWHSQGGMAKGGVGGGREVWGKRDRCRQNVTVCLTGTVEHCGVNDTAIHEAMGFVLVLFGRYNQMTLLLKQHGF